MSATMDKGGGFRAWLNKRLPVDQFVADQLTGYYAPKNFNIWYFFGSLALLVFVMQIVTGIFITMHFKAGEASAFNSVEYLRREVPYGWLLQYMHAVGASFFFIVVYLHMARAFLYGSYGRQVLGSSVADLPRAMADHGPCSQQHVTGARRSSSTSSTVPASPGSVDGSARLRYR
jgi:hypothetical protein